MTRTDAPDRAPLTLTPIGVVHSPFKDRLSAPRQPRSGASADGTLELFKASGIEYALLDLDTFRFIWVLFWFHHNVGFKPKVQPPRSAEKRGVFATRAPYRPNPIGLSAVELLGIEGRVLHVRNLDMLDGTPILDLKPYVPYTDSLPDAGSGWLDDAAAPPDPLARYPVQFAPPALVQLEFLEARGASPRAGVEEVLALGPQPHPYRRIKANGDAFVLAYKAWRLDFEVDGHSITVHGIRSGYRPSALCGPEASPELTLHREYVARFAE
jgi:tRNA-Thr(GGU) m(6)t(6)A37 methyltransferase TsaA